MPAHRSIFGLDLGEAPCRLGESFLQLASRNLFAFPDQRRGQSVAAIHEIQPNFPLMQVEIPFVGRCGSTLRMWRPLVKPQTATTPIGQTVLVLRFAIRAWRFASELSGSSVAHVRLNPLMNINLPFSMGLGMLLK